MTRTITLGFGMMTALAAAPAAGLIAAHAELFGDVERSRSYRQLAEKAAAETPLVPLFTRDDLYAVAPRVRFQPRLDSRLLAVDMALRP